MTAELISLNLRRTIKSTRNSLMVYVGGEVGKTQHSVLFPPSAVELKSVSEYKKWLLAEIDKPKSAVAHELYRLAFLAQSYSTIYLGHYSYDPGYVKAIAACVNWLITSGKTKAITADVAQDPVYTPSFSSKKMSGFAAISGFMGPYVAEPA